MRISRLLVLCTIVALMLVCMAFFNGFPIADTDTHTYIGDLLPGQRPPGGLYGYFVMLSSFHASLWFPVLVQGVLLSFVLVRYTGIVASAANMHRSEFYLPLLIAIVSFTGVSWAASALAPGIFAATLLLAVISFIVGKRPSAVGTLALFTLILVAVVMRPSHILTLTLFSVGLATYGWRSARKELLRQSMLLLLPCIASWAIIGSMNMAKGYGFAIVPGTPVYITAKFAENGLLGEFLERNCNDKHLPLCDRRANMPATVPTFLLLADSAMQAAGSKEPFLSQCRLIVRSMAVTPKYWGMFFQKTVISALGQLTQVLPPPELPAYGKGAALYQKVSATFPDESREYVTAMQHTDKISLSFYRPLYILVFLLSSAWLLLSWRKLPVRALGLIYTLVILFLVANALSTAVTAALEDRSQYSIFWVLPATNIIVLLCYYAARTPAFAHTYTQNAGDEKE